MVAKALAYSQLAAVIKTKTAEGMVPNFWQPGSISYDRTEPIVGAKVLSEIFHKFNERWIVDLLYPDLFDWLDWFFRKRREPPLNLIVLGSNSNLPVSSDDVPNNMQAARYESGLDNSPMYDGEFFNTTTSHMMLYDVGMSSMVAMELQALANLRAEKALLKQQQVRVAAARRVVAAMSLCECCGVQVPPNGAEEQLCFSCFKQRREQARVELLAQTVVGLQAARW